MGILDISLSVEEIALAMSTVGCLRSAYGLMAAQLHIEDGFDARQRLESAANALLARDLIIRANDDVLSLRKPLLTIARVMCSADCSIRFQRADSHSDAVLAAHFWRQRFYVHTIRDSVVHRLVGPCDVAAVVDAGIGFFDLAPDGYEDRTFCVPKQVLDDLGYSPNIDSVTSSNDSAGSSEEPAVVISDLASPLFKGSVLRVEYEEGNENRALKGFLVLGGARKNWLIQPQGYCGSDMYTVAQCTPMRFTAAVRSLVDL